MLQTSRFSSIELIGSSVLLLRSLSPLPFSPVPDGINAPFVSAGISRTVIVIWDEPTSSNGIILRYYLERALDGLFTRIGSVNATASRLFVDQGAVPFTTYQYRIVAVNSAGSGTGDPTTFMTPETGWQSYKIARSWVYMFLLKHNNEGLRSEVA